MKKKLLAFALVLALAVSALSLAACGSDFSNTYKNPYEDKAYAQYLDQLKVLDSAKDIGLDYSAGSLYGNKILCVFSKTVDGQPNKVVYNLDTEKVVSAVFANTETVTYSIETGLLYINDVYYDYFYVIKATLNTSTSETTYEYTLYDANGNAVATSEEAPQVKIDTVFMDNDYYRINKGGKFEKAGSRAKNAVALPAFSALIDGHYYYVNTSNKEIFVYDNSFALVNYYKLPSYATNFKYGVLNDGNVLIQYRYNVSAYDNDYTYLDGTNKVKVITQIYNLKNNETKDVETVCLFNGVAARDDMRNGSYIKYTYDNGIKNYGDVQFISNKKLDTTEKTVSIKNDGTIDRVLNEIIVAQDGAAEALSSGKFIVRTKDGAKYLVNAKGKIIADVTGAYYNEKYIVVDGKIYDHNFKEIADSTFDEEKYDVMTMNNSVVLGSMENPKQFKLFVNDAFKDVTLGDNDTLVDGTERYYVIKTTGETDTYTYYNENGVKLFETSVKLNEIGTARNGKVLLNGYDTVNAKYVTYVLSVATGK